MVAVIPSAPEPWESVLDERQQKHVDFCQNYVARYGHGAPGHLDYTVIAALANLVQEQARQIVALQSSSEGA